MLNVHVNYLNRTVKEITFKPPLIIMPAELLRKLKHYCSILNASCIAYALGLLLLPTSTTSSKNNRHRTKVATGKK
ncbi:hypothetical protein BH11BAC5_BH11BAC5_07940 [soil metagenome]